MPRFPVAFGKRKQAAPADGYQHAQTGEASSFRVLDRAEVTSGKEAVHGVQGQGEPAQARKSSMSIDVYSEDSLFADLPYNRYVCFSMKGPDLSTKTGWPGGTSGMLLRAKDEKLNLNVLVGHLTLLPLQHDKSHLSSQPPARVLFVFLLLHLHTKYQGSG